MAKIETQADQEVWACLDAHQSFALIAGAGSGKTSSLVEALERVRDREGKPLRKNGQRIACITYTKRAVAVIRERLRFDDIYVVSTLHSFLWDQISGFHSDVGKVLKERRLPALIEQQIEKDNGGQSKAAVEARQKALRYQADLQALGTVNRYVYGDVVYSDYPNGILGHDDIIEVATCLLEDNATFRRLIGLRFPYIFVDEAQDTARGIVKGLNLACGADGLPIVGYFGDPWQQIYDETEEDFAPPANGKVISKTENFRCSESVIRLLNGFRKDVEQYAAGANKGREGSVIFRLVKTERPEGHRGRYADEQTARALARLDEAMETWGWRNRDDVVKLFLVRQMIARRMGFADLNRLFTGEFASRRAQEAFEKGENFLVRPLTHTIWPLVRARRDADGRRVIDILRRDSPAFAIDGVNAAKSLRSMIDVSRGIVADLADLWEAGSVREILSFGAKHQIVRVTDRLQTHLNREARSEQYDEAHHAIEKEDWLVDEFLRMDTRGIEAYAAFISDNTAFSTQHGVKGEEYSKVLVVYDDIEASWNNYNFGKVLTPGVAGSPTDRQSARGRKLAYVSFSRALQDLRVLFFTSNPEAARAELIRNGLLSSDQIEVVD